MLLRLHRLALRLLFLRPWCLALAVAGAVATALALADFHQTQSLPLRLSLLFTLWMLMLYSCIHLFQRIPPPVLPGLPWWERLGQRLYLWSYHLLAAMVALVGLILLSLSVKLWRL